jgi:hypothetical protein
MAQFAHVRRVAAPSECGELSGVGASAAADVGFRTKESGRRVVRRVPAGASRPPASGAPALPRDAVYAVMRRQARGALRAPLKP